MKQSRNQNGLSLPLLWERKDSQIAAVGGGELDQRCATMPTADMDTQWHYTHFRCVSTRVSFARLCASVLSCKDDRAGIVGLVVFIQVERGAEGTVAVNVWSFGKLCVIITPTHHVSKQ